MENKFNEEIVESLVQPNICIESIEDNTYDSVAILSIEEAKFLLKQFGIAV